MNANTLIPPARGAAADHFEAVMQAHEAELRAVVRARLIAQCKSDAAIAEAFQDYRCDFDATPAEWVAMLERTDDEIFRDCLYWTRAEVLDAIKQDY